MTIDQKIVFREKQQFRQWWLWLLLLGLDSFILYRWYLWVQAAGGEVEGGLLTSSIVAFFVTTLFLVVKLETIIKQDGVYVRFFPLHVRFKRFGWDELAKAYVRHYNPLQEYGGWGIRFGKRGRAYNISGQWGIQLVRKQGIDVLIGTKRPEEVEAVMAGLDLFAEVDPDF